MDGLNLKMNNMITDEKYIEKLKENIKELIGLVLETRKDILSYGQDCPYKRFYHADYGNMYQDYYDKNIVPCKNKGGDCCRCTDEYFDCLEEELYEQYL